MTDEQRVLLADAFSNAMVVNGKVNFFKQYTPEQIHDIYIGFTEDLLDYNIPHYRVVGIKYDADPTQTSVLKVHAGFGMSLIELGNRVTKIIPIDCKGWEEGYGYQPENSEYKDPNRPNENINILREKEQHVGQLQYIHNNLGLTQYGNVMSTDTLRYATYKIADTVNDIPRFLIDDVEVCYTRKVFTEHDQTTLFYIKGKGVMDYPVTAKLFTYNSGVFPVKAIFDLSQYILCKYPMNGISDGLELYYNEKINEQALTEILQDYGKGLL